MGLFSGDAEDGSDSTDDDQNRSLMDRVSDKASELQEEGFTALTDHYTVRIHDYGNVGWDLSERTTSIRLDSETLEFEQPRLVRDPNTFSIPMGEIDFQSAKVWTREDHETENLNRLRFGDDHWNKAGERVFLKLPLHDGGHITISMADNEEFRETNPNVILREMRDIADVELEARHTRSEPMQASDTDEDDDEEQDPLDQLERLKELRDEGVITENEFEDKKEDLLDQI